MAARYPIPVQEDLRELLADLLGREVTAVRSDEPVPASGGAVGSYVTDDGRPAAAVVCDLAFAARAAAAITLIPSPAAEEAITERALTPTLRENLREVLNVMARLLNSAQTPHVRLQEVYAPGVAPPAEVARLIAQPADRRSFEVEIPGYGPGRVTVAVS
jgi:hypothetical protein